MSDHEPAPGLPPEDGRRRAAEPDACVRFRRLLERHLDATLGAAEEALHELAWHEHLLACGACRELLAAEEALEHFLASLPAPELPPALARRVVRRLRAHRTAGPAAEPASAQASHEAPGDALDRLLALDVAPPAAGLSARVLARLAAARDGERREAALDRLLAADALAPPAGLAGRVLAGLAAERERAAAPAPVRGRSTVWSARAWGALAAGLLAVLGAAWLVRREPPADGALVGAPAGPPDDELLAALPVLELWDLLEEHGDEVELVADPVYEVLLDFSEPLEASPERAEPPTEEKPSKG